MPSKSNKEAQMPFFSHIIELRKRLIISAAAIVIGTGIAYIWAPNVIRWLSEFYFEASKQKNAQLTQTSVLEGFALRIKVAIYGGFVIACPVWMFQLWRFITPGLEKREKRYAIPFLFSAITLFLTGGFISLLTITKALTFLLSSSGVEYYQVISASSYITFVIVMFIAFGLSFQFPVVLVFLLLARVIDTKQLRKSRRMAFFLIVVFAAVITPSQDPYSLFLMAIPMYVFYEASIIIGRILSR